MARSWLLGLVLVLWTGGLFSPVLNQGFINLDDPHYITHNKNLEKGLTTGSVAWAFSSLYVGYWQPMTWLSYLLDVNLFGFESAWGYHLTNLFWHLANTGLLYWIFLRWFRSPGWAFFGAGLFALHPLRVESVAWITERKDVLSTFFGLLSLMCYERYARVGKWRWMVLSALSLAIGLMAKPMLVTVPVLMLLMDYWPLQRSGELTWSQAILEKWLPGVVAGIFSVLTFWAQHLSTAVLSLEMLPLDQRLANAVYNYGWYLLKFFYPTDLAIFYPHPRHLYSLPLVLGIFGGLAGWTVWLWKRRGEYPQAWMGWLWYLVALIPVIGLTQAGEQGRADRFTYVPALGLSLVVVDLGRKWAASWNLGRWIRVGFCLGILGGLSWLTWQHLGFWKTEEKLYQHALRATSNNYFVHRLLGIFYFQNDRLEEAEEQLRTSLGLERPGFVRLWDAPYFLAHTLMKTGRYQEARHYLEEALVRSPGLPQGYLLYGQCLLRLPDSENKNAGFAADALQKYLSLDPQWEPAWFFLGQALGRLGQWSQAETSFEESLKRTPTQSKHWVYGYLALALVEQKKENQARLIFQRITSQYPNWLKEASDLAFHSATSQHPMDFDPPRALELAWQIHHLYTIPKSASLDLLVLAHAANGNFSRAREFLERIQPRNPAEEAILRQRQILLDKMQRPMDVERWPE